MTCVICRGTISAERRELQPRTVTCSKACSDQHTRNLRAASSARWHKRQRDARRSAQQEGQ